MLSLQLTSSIVVKKKKRKTSSTPHLFRVGPTRHAPGASFRTGGLRSRGPRGGCWDSARWWLAGSWSGRAQPPVPPVRGTRKRSTRWSTTRSTASTSSASRSSPSPPSRPTSRRFASPLPLPRIPIPTSTPPTAIRPLLLLLPCMF